MPSRHDPLRIAIQVTVYVALYFATAYFFFGPLLLWIGGYLTGTIADLASWPLCSPTGWPCAFTKTAP